MSFTSQPFLGRYFLTGAGILTSIYILVRGMDNMDQDLPPKVDDSGSTSTS